MDDKECTDYILGAEEIAEAVLIKLSEIPVVGDILQDIPIEEYDHLWQELINLVEARLIEQGWKK